MKRGHHFPVFFIPKKLMLKGFVIVLVLMPFSNKKSTIDLQRKDVYEVLLCILKRSCPRTFGLLFDLCSFVPKHLASQYQNFSGSGIVLIDNARIECIVRMYCILAARTASVASNIKGVKITNRWRL